MTSLPRATLTEPQNRPYNQLLDHRSVRTTRTCTHVLLIAEPARRSPHGLGREGPRIARLAGSLAPPRPGSSSR